MSSTVVQALLALAVLFLQAPAPVHPDLADLTARWEGAVAECGVGAFGLVVVEGGEIMHQVTLGRRDPEGDLPVTADTLFYVASTTKPYVAFACAQLAEEGKLDLDAPVKRYLPRFRIADAELTETLTVRDLLCHRQGLDSTPIVMLDAYTGEINEDRFYHFLERVVPARRVAYSNLHFTLAGRVIEAVSGATWRDYLAEHVFAPAGMTRTTGYADRMYADPDVAWPVRAEGERVLRARVRKSDRTMHAAGGLGTTLHDLGRWLALQLGRGAVGGRRLLSEDAAQAAWELQVATPPDDGMGPTEGFALGWQRGTWRDQLELRHSGGYVGCAAHVCFLPELDIGLAVVVTGGRGAQELARAAVFDVHERLLADDRARDLLPQVLEQARRARATDAAAAASAPRPAPLDLSLTTARYAGTYRDAWYGTLVIEEEDGALRARLGELAVGLTALGRDRLHFELTGLDAFEGAFELDGDAVVAVTLELAETVRFAR